mgnify:CR=1 FL=1
MENLSKNLITYDLELTQNFVNQSSFVGVNSAYRQYEVPTINLVKRQDKYQEFVIVADDINKASVLPYDTNFSESGRLGIVYSFQKDITNSINVRPISYGLMTITKETNGVLPDNVEEFDIPINTFAVGNTLNFQLEMSDNYSVGPAIKD